MVRKDKIGRRKRVVKEKILQVFESISGVTSLFGSWQVCHSICLGLVALLGIFGIAVAGLPLYFLNQYAFWLWGTAVGFLLVTFGVYLWKKCVSGKLLLMNLGFIVIGVPFQSVQEYRYVFWIIGGIFVVLALALFISDKLEKRKMRQRIKMNSDNIYLFFGILFILVLAGGLLLAWEYGFNNNVPGGNGYSKEFDAKSSGGTENGDVEIVLTPKGIDNGVLRVELSANTHSVELSQFDLKQLTILEYNGKRINPGSAPKLSSHHGSGVLTFDVGKDISRFKITITEIPLDKERVFEWR